MRKKIQSFEVNKYGFSMTRPEDIRTTFDDLIGVNSAKKELTLLANYLKSGKKNTTQGVAPYTRIILEGPLGIGKSSIVYAVAKASNLPVFTICGSSLASKKTALRRLNSLFKTASSMSPSIILIKDIDYVANLDDDFYMIFAENLFNLIKKYKDITIFATETSNTQEEEGLPAFLYETDGFEKRIVFVYPELKYREELLRKFSSDYQISEDVNFNRLAKDCYEMSPGDLKKIVKDAVLLSKRENHEKVTHSDFDEIITAIDLGERRRKLKDEERLATAYHEAGHVVAGYFSNPKFEISKVEVAYRDFTLGVTFAVEDEDKFSKYSKDYKMDIICFFGGKAAEQEVYGDTTSGVSSDFSAATQTAKMMVYKVGMNANVGNVIVDMLSSEELKNLAAKEVVNLLNNLYQECFDIIHSHRDYLDAIAIPLCEKEILTGSEVKTIIDEVTSKRKSNS